VPPGVLVIVHAPDGGKPFSITLPVDTTQLGCVIVPTDGGEGAPGAVPITTFADGCDIQPDELVTVNV